MRYNHIYIIFNWYKLHTHIIIVNQTKMEGGTERHLPKIYDHVVGSAGERCKDVEMKRKNME